MFKKRDISNIVLILTGGFLFGFGINAFFIPHKLMSGGVSGFAVFIHLLSDFDTGLLIILLNIPIFLLGIKNTDKKFIIYSFLGLVSSSITLFLTKNIEIPMNDLLTSVLTGGCVCGLGTGLAFRGNGSTGGTDVLAKIINKAFSFSISSVIFGLNVLVVSLSAFGFGLDIAVYTLAAMFVSGAVTNFVVDGLNYKRSAFIITDKYEVLTQIIIKELKRGVTVIDAKGGYSNESKKILFTTVGMRQVSKLKEIVKENDPDAFVTINETAQVFGKGFINLKES